MALTDADTIPQAEFFNSRTLNVADALMPSVKFHLYICPFCGTNVIIQKYRFYWDATCMQACTIAEWRPGMKEWRMFERKPVEVAPDVVAQEEELGFAQSDLDLAELMEEHEISDEDLERIFGRANFDEDPTFGEEL